MTRTLGRMEPSDWKHVTKYGLTAETIPDKPTPVIAGTNWYQAFDTPTWDATGRFWMIGRGFAWGRVRGGHAYCLKPQNLVDTSGWWTFYDQGSEGACVGFSISRAMSLLNRERYAAPWLYREAQLIDEWEGEDYSGTSVRAGLDVLREVGHRRSYRRGSTVTWVVPGQAHGIVRNRWAESVEDMVAALHSPRYLQIGRVPLLNSWGESWPHVVWLPLEAVARLMQEDGEFAVLYDR